MTVADTSDDAVVLESEENNGETTGSPTAEKVTTTVTDDVVNKSLHHDHPEDKDADKDEVLQWLLLLQHQASSSTCSPNNISTITNNNINFQMTTTLNLSNTGLSSLPDHFANTFPQLSILFLSNNKFMEVPAVIGKCQYLQMVAFKSNIDKNNGCSLSSIHPDALQSQLRWLILTDNQITSLPRTIGRCIHLQKLMLSGNLLTSLPNEIINCQNLELIRLASNHLQYPPIQLLQQLPKLAWVGLSDNPFLLSSSLSSNVSVSQPVVPKQQSPIVVLHDLDESLLDSSDNNVKVLGRGAGGVTYQLKYQNEYVAVKQFASEMTSDGLPIQERQISWQVSQLATEKNCFALIRILGETYPSGFLVMEYLHNYQALANPPSLQSCSRDVYDDDCTKKKSWTTEQAIQVLASLLQALVELHKIGICHGDFYGHNILIRHSDHENDDSNDNNDNMKIHARLTDFGAAFNYDTTSEYGKLLKQIELRAYAHLVQEVIDHLIDDDDDDDDKSTKILMDLVVQCRKPATTLDTVYVWLKQRATQSHGVCL